MRRSSIMPATFWNTKYKRGISYNPKICVSISSGMAPWGPAQELLSFWGRAQERNEEAGRRRWAWWAKRWRRRRRTTTRGRTRSWRRTRCTRRENFARNSFGTQNPHQAQAYNVNIFFSWSSSVFAWMESWDFWGQYHPRELQTLEYRLSTPSLFPPS